MSYSQSVGNKCDNEEINVRNNTGLTENDSLYLSLSKELFGTQKRHLAERSQVMDHIKENAEKYASSINATVGTKSNSLDNTVKKYTRKGREQGVRPSSLELRVISRMTGMDVGIYGDENKLHKLHAPNVRQTGSGIHLEKRQNMEITEL